MAKKKTASQEPEVMPGTVEILEAEVVEIPQELAIIKQEYGLKLADELIENHITTYAPYFKALVDLEPEMTALLTKEITADTMKEATALRKQYRDIRLAADKQKKSDKESIVVEGKFLDTIFNRVKGGAESKEDQCEEIENKLKTEEAERIAEIRESRIAQLEAVDYDTEFLTVEDMTEESFARLLAKATAAKEALQLSEQQREEAKQREKEAAQQKAERINRLASLGLIWNESTSKYTGKDADLEAGILTTSDDEFFDIVNCIEADQAARLKAEADALQAEKDAAARLTSRINKVTSLGFKWNDEKQSYENDDYSIGLGYLKSESEDGFNNSVAKVEAVVAEQKEKAAQYERREQYLLDLGFEYDEDADNYKLDTRIITADDVESLGVAEFSAIYSDAKKYVDDKHQEALDRKKADDAKLAEAAKIKAQEAARLKKIEDEKKAEAETLRVAALAPDKTKVGTIYRTIRDIEFPEMATPEGKAALVRIKALQDKFLLFIADEGKKLA